MSLKSDRKECTNIEKYHFIVFQERYTISAFKNNAEK